MTQAQKRLFAGLKSGDQRAEFVDIIRQQQLLMGRYDHWQAAYSAKCRQQAKSESI